MQLLKTLFTCTTFLFLIPITANTQTPVKHYEKEWKKVEDLVLKKNLPKSALGEVKKIYTLAKNEKQDAQVIKALVYIIGLQQETREENETAGIREMEKEIIGSREPATSILNSLLAEMYRNLYQQKRWQLYNRTETVNFKKDDPNTWTAGDFHKKITGLYLLSIRQEKLLQQTKLEPYDAIIVKGNVRHLRPSLFDLLAHRALDYFKNDERNIAKPAYAFQIGQASALDPAAAFVNHKFDTRDSLSLQHKALLIYQELIAFHLRDAKPDALLDADLQRLEFVYDRSTHPDKKELFREAVKQIGTKYGELPAASQAWYLLARELNKDGISYQPLGDTTHRYARVLAKEICERIISQKDSSEGKINCRNLLNEITKQEIQFSIEKINIPDQPFRSLIQYRNVEKIFFRIIRPGEKLKEKLSNYYNEEMWKSLLAVPSIRSWQQPLPATNDHQLHAAEIKVDALPAGEYMLLAASDDFSNNAVIGARLFYVSNISYINRGNDHFVLHRESGQPLANAAVQVWQQVYDYKTYKTTNEKGRLYQTDKNGFFSMTDTSSASINRSISNYKLEINWNSDKLLMDEWQYDYYYNRINREEEKETRRIFFFTDRSIYRPGQTLYFKGIAISSDKEKTNKVLDGFKTKVFLSDANDEVADSLEIVTNEYGSFSGKFQLPQGPLNGEFSIHDKEQYGSARFSVEEYKRPKFYVEYEKIKGTFKAGDSISVTGLAKAYAGNNIDGATVKYRVIRQPRFIYPWLFWRWWQPPVAPMEIAHGEAKTDKDGKFVIPFLAIPDKTIDKKFEPVFDYKIYSDVTDINGETRSGETVVSAGYKSLVLKVSLPALLPADSLKNISIRTENMAGEFESSVATVTISKLKEEKRLIRHRYWQQPDQFVMTKEEYIKSFPLDEYSNESDYSNWKILKEVFTKSDSVKVDGSWFIGHSPSTMNGELRIPGFYKIEISVKNKTGEEVKDVKFIELFDEKNKQLSKPQYLRTRGSQPVAPGEKAYVEIGTAASDIFLIQQTDKKTINEKPNTINYSFSQLNNEKRSFDFTATEQDRGGYGVHFFFVKHNRFYTYTDIINVPWTHKDLKIEYSTFRDKTLPGSGEQWKVKISGYKKEQVAAEMLAGMYDASLDQFKPHQWNKPSIWPQYNIYSRWNGGRNFSESKSQQKWIFQNNWKDFEKNYDRIFFQNSYLLGDVVVTAMGIKSKKRNEEMILMEQNISIADSTKFGDAFSGSVAGLIVKDNDENKDQFEVETKIITANEIQIRKNFNETAFFFPGLRTDSSGAVEFSFTMPEALTRWKFQALAHTKELALGYSSREIVTQKELMVQPNAPRFLREGDQVEFSAKIVNLSGKEMTGQAGLLLFDATTSHPVDGWFRNMFPNQYFTVAAGQSEVVKFPIQVPYLFNKALTWRVVASAGMFSDGEENSMPVLTNKLLVTESLPLKVKGSGTKNFKFEKLLNTSSAEGGREGVSESLQHHAITVEYTSNPAWYAVQALPYLMEFPYECAEQTWNRYYANSLATMIANSSPRIRSIFESWKIKDTAALLSNLQKNEELKSLLLQETPWVPEAKNEAERKKNMVLLFDMIRMSNELNTSLEKLKQMQSPNGGFVWFSGGPDNRYMTQYIITGMGHLKKLKGNFADHEDRLYSVVQLAMPYLDKKIKEDYNQLLKNKTDLKNYIPGHLEVQYLYMRSFFPEIKVPSSAQAAYNFISKRAQQSWTRQSKYMQGMIALVCFRNGDTKTAHAILKSLKETAITSEEMGMYWKNTGGGWFWHQAPVETQALLVEAFLEISKDSATVNELKVWLLKNKQTNNWKTTKATAEACYALLLQGTNWLAAEPAVEIKLGEVSIKSSAADETGTGYFKKTIEGRLVNAGMGNISVSLTHGPAPAGEGGSLSYGAVYWQYFENLDKITAAATPLQLIKKLFTEKNTDRGPVLTPVPEGGTIQVGDKIKIRIELRVDRDMEYVHMKDMRASALEPVNVISSYKWQGGLGYYESTKDASTHFFFDYLRKGTYVFEYTLFATHAGSFSNGITSIQCMYAPEFASHSEGIRINIEQDE